MEKTWIVAVALLLPGCSLLATECAQERMALRQADSAIAHATRSQKGVFSAQLASRGHASYDCAPTRSGQVRCTRSAGPRNSASMDALYRKRDAAAARVAEYCQR